MKLTTKILLLLFVVVTLVTFVAGTISVRSAYASLTKQQELLTKQLADDMEDLLSDAWVRAAREVSTARFMIGSSSMTNRCCWSLYCSAQCRPTIDAPRAARSLAGLAARSHLLAGKCGRFGATQPSHIHPGRQRSR